MPSPVIRVRPTPNSAKTRPSSAPRSSSRMTGSSGCLAVRMNLTQLCLPRTWFDSMIAVRNENDSAMMAPDQHGQRNPPEVALDGVRVLDLLPRLVQREEAADAEQHDRDDEGVNVAFAAVAEGVFRAGCPLGALAADQQQDLVAGVRERVDGLRQHR